MNTQLRIAAAAVAVVVLALIVFNFLPRTGTVGGPPPTLPPAPSQSPVALLADPNGAVGLDAGTYRAGDPFPVPVTFTVPSGWEGTIPGPNLVDLTEVQSSGEVTFSIFDKVYANPCHYQGPLNPVPGSTVDDLATALASLPGVAATPPTDVAVSGFL
ncbi:MAG: hypothetical protein ACRDGI_07285, partial [Candidatus Limnocylindrales bacterium]